MNEVSTTVTVVGLIIAAVPTVIGFLTVRAINSVDAHLAGLSVKVDNLSRSDTEIQISLAKLDSRLVNLEKEVFGGQRPRGRK